MNDQVSLQKNKKDLYYIKPLLICSDTHRENYSTRLRTVVFCFLVFFFTDNDTPCNSIHYNNFPPKSI